MLHSKSLHTNIHWFLFLALVATTWAQPNFATPYHFTTLAGESSIGSADGTGRNARFNTPNSLAVDIAGNLYVADSLNHTIRKISSAGVVTTLAGAAGYAGSTDGTGPAARFNYLAGIAVDPTGNLYVSDNNTIRKITPSGTVTTLAGTAGISGSTDGTGSAARFSSPEGIASDAAGNLYVADHLNHTIRKITPAGVVTTLAGTTGVQGVTDGTGSAAYINWPDSVAVDAAGNVYVAEAGANLGNPLNTIRKISPTGVVTTIPSPPRSTADSSVSGWPQGIAIDATGNLYLIDYNEHLILKMTPSGVATTLAGTTGQFGSTDGTGSAARFYFPLGVAADAAGNIYVADGGNNTIRKISSGAEVTTIAGLGYFTSHGGNDGTGSAAHFNRPCQVAVGPTGDVYVADSENHIIRVVTPAGLVMTLAGTPSASGSADGTGAAARFNSPHGMAVDAASNLYVADWGNNLIRKITPGGVVTTLAGDVTLGSRAIGNADGSGSAARFDHPRGIAVDTAGTLYVADTGNNLIRKITPAGAVTTLAGSRSISFDLLVDGSGTTARFNYPEGITIDGTGTLYVADSGNHAIRRITPDGAVTTLAGGSPTQYGYPYGFSDGKGTAAHFFYPSGIAVDHAGILYVADSSNELVRKITPEGEVSTLAGLVGAKGSADGTGNEVRFSFLESVAVDNTGNLFVTTESTIRKGQLAGPPVITTQPLSQTVAPGTNVQFSVTAGGVPAPTYQWFSNGSAFNGATTNTLSFTNARSADAGDYTVVVTNELGSVTSAKATLTISSASLSPPPTPTSAPAGGGSIESWFVLAFIMLGTARCFAARAIRP